MRLNRESLTRLVTRVQTTAELAQNRACTITATAGRVHVSACCDTHAVTMADDVNPNADIATWQPASVNAAALLGVLSGISSARVDLEVIDGKHLHIRHDAGAVSLAIVRAQEPPSSERPMLVATVSGATLRRAMGIVRYAEQKHGDRTILDGTHIAIDDGSVTVSTSNGFSACTALLLDPDARVSVPSAVLFPTPAAARVICEMERSDIDVTRVSAKWLALADRIGADTVYIRQHTAEFPAASVEKFATPAAHWPAYTIDAGELRAAMQVCAAVADKREAAVEIWHRPSGLYLRTMEGWGGKLGEVTEHYVEAARDDDGDIGNRESVGVDARKLAAALGACTGRVRVSLPVDPVDCILVHDAIDGRGLVRHVIMPMRRK